jgi:hypothetical protein
MTDLKATLRSKAGAAAVLLLASAPITFIIARLYLHFTRVDPLQPSLALFEAERFLVFLTIGLLAYGILNRRLTGTMLTLALWAAGIASQYPSLILWAEGVPASAVPRSFLSESAGVIPHSSIILLTCTALLGVLMSMIPFKRLRSIDRLYIISIGTFVLGTTAIFNATLGAGLQAIPLPLAVPGEAASISFDDYNKISDQFDTMFATLSITVHAAWILAALIGLAIHKNNLSKRLREQRTIDDYVEKRFYEFISG